jgi:hypothetical protein
MRPVRVTREFGPGHYLRDGRAFPTRRREVQLGFGHGERTLGKLQPVGGTLG